MDRYQRNLRCVLLGVIIPSDSLLAKSFQAKLKEPVTVLLLRHFRLHWNANRDRSVERLESVGSFA